MSDLSQWSSLGCCKIVVHVSLVTFPGSATLYATSFPVMVEEGRRGGLEGSFWGPRETEALLNTCETHVRSSLLNTCVLSQFTSLRKIELEACSIDAEHAATS